MGEAPDCTQPSLLAFSITYSQSFILVGVIVATQMRGFLVNLVGNCPSPKHTSHFTHNHTYTHTQNLYFYRVSHNECSLTPFTHWASEYILPLPFFPHAQNTCRHSVHTLVSSHTGIITHEHIMYTLVSMHTQDTLTCAHLGETVPLMEFCTHIELYYRAELGDHGNVGNLF